MAQELENLDARVAVNSADLMSGSPITTERLAEGALSVWTLCKVIMYWSDSAAANLLMASQAGPSGSPVPALPAV